jgi:hypothetical protein
MTDVSKADVATTWADMTDWHRVSDPIGPDYMERVERSALEGQDVDLSAVPRFRVIRETWDETTDPRTRVIHELEVVG